jgi:energy-coupling factor transporter ATP-binding protein EcfA2
MSTNIEQGFKVIAIKILDGCYPSYFYNDFLIDEEGTISYTDKVPDNFYNTSKLNVNISAIVGKNGSGKSTVVELLFRALNNIALKKGNLSAELTYIPGLYVEIFIHTHDFYSVKVEGSSITAFQYHESGKRIKTPIKNFTLKSLFYTIAVNYSHYAYNVNELGSEVNWLDKLFHKNDGYQTPLVINPMRKNGNIDINNENHLVKSRLIANLLRPINDESQGFRKISDKLQAFSLNLTLNKSKGITVIYELPNKIKKNTEQVRLNNLSIDRDKLLGKLATVFRFNYRQINKEEYKLAFDYIIYKLVSIAIKYDDYTGYFSIKDKFFIEDKITDYFKILKDDNSHITFKLKQTINFIKYRYLSLNNQEISLDSLSSKIQEEISKTSKSKHFEISLFAPPPIFSIDILLKDGEENIVEFNKLSSGEKQMTYSVSSILYHLINLNSVPNTRNRINYKYVNILFEEIELYFHPEMQRSYIKTILDSIGRLGLKNIKSINICFVTHSPFILSDIPQSNILFLKDDGTPMRSDEQIQTFGGNIHELLAHSFFLGNGFIGDFAKNRIQNIIRYLKPNSSEDSIIDSHYNKVSVLKEIELIGEPFLRDKLKQYYYEKFDTQKRILELKKQIKFLEQEQND